VQLASQNDEVLEWRRKNIDHRLLSKEQRSAISGFCGDPHSTVTKRSLWLGAIRRIVILEVSVLAIPVIGIHQQVFSSWHSGIWSPAQWASSAPE
jgi:type IV secretory pathway TrbD component